MFETVISETVFGPFPTRIGVARAPVTIINFAFFVRGASCWILYKLRDFHRVLNRNELFQPVHVRPQLLRFPPPLHKNPKWISQNLAAFRPFSQPYYILLLETLNFLQFSGISLERASGILESRLFGGRWSWYVGQRWFLGVLFCPTFWAKSWGPLLVNFWSGRVLRNLWSFLLVP